MTYLGKRPDKFFFVVTAPPRKALPQDGRIARGFNNWLCNNWLDENNYPLKNVMVFDLFNILTSRESWQENDLGSESGNHHRLWDGREQHVVGLDNHLLVYPRDGKEDNHPSKAGLQKATKEFVPLFISNYLEWKSSLGHDPENGSL